MVEQSRLHEMMGAGSRGGTPMATGLKRTYLDLKPQASTPRAGDHAMGDLSQIPDASRTMNEEEDEANIVSEEVEFPIAAKRQRISSDM